MWDFRARLTRPHDGDTFRVLADTMFGQRYEPDLRLTDVYAPELSEPGGPETLRFVNDWFAGCDTRYSWPLYVITEKAPVFELPQRISARYLATVWRYGYQPGDYETSLNFAVQQFLGENPQWGGGTGARPVGEAA